MSNSNQFIDVHTFDTRLEPISLERKVSLEDKFELFKWIHNAFKRYNLQKEGLNMVIVDTQKSPNYDGTNDFWADDILAEICITVASFDVVRQLDILKLVSEQLQDMYNTGRCQQGRSIRLFQIWKSIKDV